MLHNYIIVSIRNLLKNKMLSTVNFLGLTIGLASVMSLAFTVYAYYYADAPIKYKENLVYLKTFTSTGHSFPATTYPLINEIKKTCPEVEVATNMFGWNAPWLSYKNIEIQEERTSYVHADFFKVFTLPLKYGDPKTALQNKYDVVLTDKVSKKFFGDGNPVGKTLISNDTISLTVAGVLESLSSYSSLQLGVLLNHSILEDDVNFKNNSGWNNSFVQNYIRLKPGSDIQKLEAKIKELVQLNYDNSLSVKSIKAVPYTQLRSDVVPIAKFIIIGCIATAIFVLLIIMVNLVNLNTSLIYDRTQQIAVRKVLGGSKRGIIKQFCIENSMIVMLSSLSALLLFLLILLPEINTIFGSNYGSISLSLSKDYPFLLYFLGLGILITILVSILPILRFISLPISTAIKGKVDVAKNNYFSRNAFITLQFALSILFICIAIILNYQIDFMQNTPVGYNQENIMVAKINLTYKDKVSAEKKFAAIIDKLNVNPYVLDFSTAEMTPTAYSRNYSDFHSKETGQQIRTRYANSDAHYLRTLDIPVIEGRDFDENLETQKGEAVIINKTAMKALGWDTIENRRLTYINDKGEGYKVVGVMQDFHYQGVEQPIEPLVHIYSGKRRLANNNYLNLKIVNGKEKEVLQALEKDFESISSRRSFEYEALSDKITAQYDLLRGMLKIINFVAFLTISISCMGMFGLISLITRKRIKEIGIRKVLGASIAKILILLSKEFLLLVAVAGCVAIPFAWWFMNTWLQTFAYRIDIQWWMLLLGGLIALMITILTVSYHSIKASLANPVKSLRTE